MRHSFLSLTNTLKLVNIEEAEENVCFNQKLLNIFKKNLQATHQLKITVKDLLVLCWLISVLLKYYIHTIYNKI